MDSSPDISPEPAPSAPPKQEINFWHFYAAISTIAVTLLTFTGFNLQPSRRVLPPQAPITNPTTSPLRKYAPPPTPTIPTSRTTPSAGTSPGVFFPYNQGVTINNPTPTIIGKISQQSGIFLATKFGPEISPVSGDSGNFLRFIPGRIKNLTLTIDDQVISNVFGIAQYPTIHCVTKTTNANGTSSYDPATNQKIPPDILYSTQTDCIEGKQADLPPLIFFAKISTPLSAGKHTLTLSGGGTRKSMDFYINEDYHFSSQNVFSINSQNDYQSPLMRSDTCMPGYYYDRDHIKFPVPDYKNPNLLYGLSFPQSQEERGSINRRGVQIDFDGNRFDLFFPQFNTFYQDETKTSSSGIYMDPFHELFLPRNQLVFSNGQKADYFKVTGAYVGSGYFEIFTTDLTGGQYRNSSIPFNLSGSSSCDG